MKFNWKYQTGSTASFILIGIAMVLVFTGSVYFVNQRSQQARKSSEIAVTTTKKPAEKPKATVSKPPVPTSTSGNQSATNSTTTSATNDLKSELPTTGSGLVWVNMLAVSALTVAIIEYIASRNRKARLLTL